MRPLTWVTALALLAAAAGCAPVPRFGPPPTVGPPYIPPPEPVWVVLDPGLYARADTAASPAGRPAPTPSRRTTPRQPGPELEPSSRGSGDPLAPALPGEAAGIAVRPGTAPPRPGGTIAIDLPPADQARLDRAARRNLAAADSLVQQAGRRASASSRREKLETAIGLMTQAREALARGDARAAANLAYKARLLAAEAGR